MEKITETTTCIGSARFLPSTVAELLAILPAGQAVDLSR